MEKKLNTIYEFEFADGSKTDLTLAFYKLYQLKAKNPALYAKYNKLAQNKNIDTIEMIQILYVAYVCAHLDAEEMLTEKEFMILCGSDLKAVGKAIEVLYDPKKNQASGKHSGKKQNQ